MIWNLQAEHKSGDINVKIFLILIQHYSLNLRTFLLFRIL